MRALAARSTAYTGTTWGTRKGYSTKKFSWQCNKSVANSNRNHSGVCAREIQLPSNNSEIRTFRCTSPWSGESPACSWGCASVHQETRGQDSGTVVMHSIVAMCTCTYVYHISAVCCFWSLQCMYNWLIHQTYVQHFVGNLIVSKYVSKSINN